MAEKPTKTTSKRESRTPRYVRLGFLEEYTLLAGKLKHFAEKSRVLSRLLPASTVMISTWPRFIDSDGSITHCGAIQASDGVARAFFARHLDKAKAFTLAAITIDDNMHINHFPVSAEQLRQLGIVSRIGEISHINACGHFGLSFSQAGTHNAPGSLT